MPAEPEPTTHVTIDHDAGTYRVEGVTHFGACTVTIGGQWFPAMSVSSRFTIAEGRLDCPPPPPSPEP